MALDLMPDNHPDVRPEQMLLQITAIRQGVADESSDRAEWCDLMAAQAKSMETVWSHLEDNVWDKV